MREIIDADTHSVCCNRPDQHPDTGEILGCCGCPEPEHGPCAQISITALAAHSAQGVGDGIALIAAERARQVEAEGWTPEHDAEHSGEELASAAACYATPKKWRPFPVREDGQAPLIWPWQPKWWKPGDRIRELAKAGALVAAEIDRLQRAAPTKETP